jgi:plasmid maintenance system antidote protein VapI
MSEKFHKEFESSLKYLINVLHPVPKNSIKNLQRSRKGVTKALYLKINIYSLPLWHSTR